MKLQNSFVAFILLANVNVDDAQQVSIFAAARSGNQVDQEIHNEDIIKENLLRERSVDIEAMR